MKNKKVAILSFVFLVVTFYTTGISIQSISAQKPPEYRKAAYAGESVALSNEFLTINFYKRVAGWGWGEIYTSDGKADGST